MTMNSKFDRDYLVLKQYGCTYLGDSYDARTHKGPSPYCACKDLVEGTLYCTEHYPLMYQKGSALRKRGKDIKKANAIRDIISDFDAAVSELEDEGFDFNIVPSEELV